VNERL